MPKLLVPVDGSPSAQRAVVHAIKRAQATASTLLLVNAQLPIRAREVSDRMTEAEIQKYLQSTGEKTLASARELADAAGVSYRVAVEIGEIAPALVRCAEREAADEIIMGTRGMGSFANLIIGSVANKVIHLSGVPVTLVK